MDGSDRDGSASGRREPLRRAGGMEERGAAAAWLGSVRRELPRAARKGMAPGNGQLLGKTKENCTNWL